MEITAGNILLIGSILLLSSVVASKAGSRFGFPVLVVFLTVGMLFGIDGIGIKFDNPHIAQFVGTVALSVILFSGGMETKFSEIKPVLIPGVVLATAGVVLMMLFTGGCIYALSLISGGKIVLTLAESMLLAAVMSSTDSASVFAILRPQKKSLKHNLRPLIELESGSNDPMAYMLTVIMLQTVVAGGFNFWNAMLSFVMQMGIGAAMGYLLGKLTVTFINKINIDNKSLYSVLLLAAVFFIFSLTDLVRGNGFLAVYIAGLVIGNKKMVFKRGLTTFFGGFTWLFQVMVFLTLGLFVNPAELIDIAGMGAIIAVIMILIARPLTVLFCLVPFRRFSTRAMGYVSWVGLRGATPIIFAIYPMVEGMEHASAIFNIVFCITLISLLVQGTTVGYFANMLDLSEEPQKRAFDLDLPDEIKSALSEIEVIPLLLENGDLLKNLALPDNTLVVMIQQDGHYFVPKATTQLRSGDRLLVISDNDDQLRESYLDLGIMNPMERL